jgi:hypothetical protein
MPRFKQRSFPILGGILVTLTGTMFWFNVISFLYTTTILWTLRSSDILAIFPWMNLLLFITLGALAIVIPVATIEYLILQPSRQAFTNSQELKHQSPYAGQLSRIENNQKKIMAKIGLEADE